MFLLLTLVPNKKRTVAMKTLVLIALVACSLGTLIQAASVAEEPVRPLEEVQGNDFGAKEETIDSSDEGFEDDPNEDNAPGDDDEEEEDAYDEDEDEGTVDDEEFHEDEIDDLER